MNYITSDHSVYTNDDILVNSEDLSTSDELATDAEVMQMLDNIFGS